MGLMKFKSIRATPLPPKPAVQVMVPAEAAAKTMSPKDLVDLAHTIVGGVPFIGLPHDDLQRLVSPASTANTPAPKIANAVTLYNDSSTGVGFKVWSIERHGATITVRWGKWGAVNQRKVTSFRSEWKAELEMHRLVASKRAKGYRDHC